MDFKNLILQILAHGARGNTEHIYQWGKMLYEIFQDPLPEPLLDFKEAYEKEKEIFLKKKIDHFSENWNLTVINEILAELLKNGDIIKTPPYGEYRIRKKEENYSLKKFFVSNNFQFYPLQYIRSKVECLCELYAVSQEEKEEIIIVVTEAAENALKYSNTSPIYVEQEIKNQIFYLQMYNCVSDFDLNLEISKGKFSQDASLMRGILVMSRLTDEIDIRRNSEKNRVELFAKKKLKSHQGG